MCWLVILGLLGWLSDPAYRQAGRDKPRDIPESVPDSDAYMETPDISGDIPGYLRNIPAVVEAERVVRSGR